MYRVLVTGIGGPAGNAVVQSLCPKRNIRVIGTDIDQFAVGRFGVDKFYIIPSAIDSDFINVLLRICKDERINVLIPTVDEEIYVLSKFVDRFRKIGTTIPIPNEKTIEIAKDKWQTVNKMKELGIPIPQTFAPSNKKEFTQAVKALGMPCVKKMRTGRGGRGFEIIDNWQDARRIMKRGQFDSILLQEYLDGDLYLIQLLGDGKGNPLTSIIHRRLKTKDKLSGTATSATTVRHKYVKKYGERLVASLNWKGVVSPEFMTSSKYGYSSPLLIEINPRIAGQSYLSTCAGVNLAYYLVMVGLEKVRRKDVPSTYKLGNTFFRIWKDAVFDRNELKQFKVNRSR